MIIIHFLLVIFLFILFSLTYLFIYYFYHFLIYLLIYLYMQLFNFKNFIFLQGNLPLEFKEGGTLLGRFWRGIWNWEDCFWLEDLKKEEKKKGRRRIFLFGNKFRSWGVIYIGEKRKRIGRFFLGAEHTEFWKKARDFEWRSGCHLIIKRGFSLSLQRLVFYIVLLFSLDFFLEILVFD